jgi:chromosome segregation ATPase
MPGGVRMTQEEFQKIVISELRGIKSAIGTLKSDVTTLKNDVGVLKSDFATLKSEIKFVKEDLIGLRDRMGNMEERLGETNDIVKAIRHNQDFANAKLEALETSTANIEGVQQIQSEVNVLGRKVYELAK